MPRIVRSAEVAWEGSLSRGSGNITGFDTTSGYPTGDVHLQTRCGGSGRGGGYHTTTYTAWAGATWDFGGGFNAGAYVKGTDAKEALYTVKGKDWSKERLVGFVSYSF